MESHKLPWWIGFPASIGFSVMGIVAPTFLPIWAQAALFGAGAVAVIWSVFAGIWHWWRKPRAPSKPQTRKRATELAAEEINRAVQLSNRATPPLTIDRLRALAPPFETLEERVTRERAETLERERQGIITQAELDRDNALTKQRKRRSLIDECRDLAHKYTNDGGGVGFRAFLEGERAYADIRGHLSADYLTKLNAVRMMYADASGARYKTLVSWFLDDLDRLEREWGLT